MKRSGFLIVAVSCLFMVLSLWTACASKTEKSADSEQVKREASEALEAAKTYAAQKKRAYQEKVETELNELNRAIDRLQAEAQQAGSKTKAEFMKEIGKLEKQKESANKKLAELKSQSAEAWEDFKADFDAALEELKRSYDRAKSHLKEKRS